MAGKIFVNYRRGESLKDARHLATLLDRGAFKGRIFIDLKGLDGQGDWLSELQRQVAGSVAMVSVICKDWSEIKDRDGNRRLDNPSDFVRFELAQAFMRKIPVIPVLVDDATMPLGSRLPPDLLPLTLLPQAEVLRTATFDADVERIATRIRSALAGKPKASGLPVWAFGLGVAAAVVGGVSVAPVVRPLIGLAGPVEVSSQQLMQDLAKADGEVERLETELKRVGDQSALLASAREALKSQQKQLAEAEAKLAAAEEQAKALQSERDRLSGQLVEAESAQDPLRAEVARLERALLAETAKVDEASRQIAELERRLALAEQREGEALAKSNDFAAELGLLKKVKLAQSESLKPGTVFRDEGCPGGCPEMVVVPAGEFMMGANDGSDDEKPPHEVMIAKPFAVGRFEVTFAEWDACVADKGCDHKPDNEGWVGGRQPVINVSWQDAQQFVAWMSAKTKKTYRLLSEAEWEYAARAGSTTKYFWGDEIGKGNANCDGCGSQWDNKQTAPVGSFSRNAFGLHDMHGNVWEWVEDNWHKSYAGYPPSDGSVWPGGNASFRVVRGGSWNDRPENLRSADRGRVRPDFRYGDRGFRLARTL